MAGCFNCAFYQSERCSICDIIVYTMQKSKAKLPDNIDLNLDSKSLIKCPAFAARGGFHCS